jgi:hypothetical protein
LGWDATISQVLDSSFGIYPLIWTHYIAIALA